MMVDVHLADGRTTVRFVSRAQVINLIQRDPAEVDQAGSFRVWIDRGQGEGFGPSRLHYVRKHSISWIERVAPDVGDAFLAREAPEILERIQARRVEFAQQPEAAVGA